MPIRLIAVDIDGTLLDSRGKLPAVNRQAVHDALGAGVVVTLVTGRTYHHAQPVATALAPQGDALTLIVSNGALIKRANGETLHRCVLERSHAREIIETVRQRRAGAALIFDRPGAEQYIYEGIDWQHPNRRAYYERNKVFMTEHSPLEDALTDDPVQVAFTGGVTEMRDLAKHLRALSLARHVTITLTEYIARDFSLLDVIAGGCSKGSALAVWTEMLGIEAASVMAVGDNLNDREMLAFSGHPVVMGNAVPDLKTLGWTMTGRHDDGGLADAIRHALSDGHASTR